MKPIFPPGHDFVRVLLIILVAVILLRQYGQILTSDSIGIAQGNTDFLALYTAAQILAAGHAPLLYDIPTQESYQRQILNSLHSSITFEGGVLPYVYPPIVATLYAPLAHFPFWNAFIVWNCFTLVLMLLGLLVLIRMQNMLQIASWPALILSIVGFLPFFIVIVQGQNTFIALLFLILTLGLMNQSEDVPAGFFLSLVGIKPQLLPLFFVVAIIKKRWKMLFGSLLGVIFMIAVSLAVLGMDCCLGYVKLLLQMPPYIYQYGRMSFRGQVYGLLFDCCPRAAAFVNMAGIAGLAALTLWAWKGPWEPRSNDFELKMSLTVIAALLISPVNFHEMSFLILPIFSIYGVVSRGAMPPGMKRTFLIALLLIGYVFPFAQLGIGIGYRYQPMVLGMMALVGVLLFQIKRATQLTNPLH
jgi:alpha-1,2-mannosyltransferase